MFIHAPSDDCHLLFRGAPMSLLYAIAVLYDRVRTGCYPPFNADSVRLWDAALHWHGDGGALERELREKIGEATLAFAGISCSSYSYRWAIKIAQLIKDVAPGCAVVIGGPHEDECGPIGDGASISDYGRFFDFSVQGDGEHILDDLFRRFVQNGCDVGKTKVELEADESALQAVAGAGGIAFLADNGTAIWRKTSPRFAQGLSRSTAAVHDLDDLPIPPRHLLDRGHRYLFDVFVHRDGSQKATAQIMTHRGCTFACNFCTERGSYNARTPARVVEELRSLAHDGFEAVFFDDSTLHNYKPLPDMLRELEYLRGELRLEFGGLTRVDSVIQNQGRCPLSLFVDAGFTYLYFGLEHVDDSVLAEIRKGYTVAEIKKCFELLSTSPRLQIGVSTLFGFESETEWSIRQTLRFVAETDQIILGNMSVIAYHPASVLLRATGLKPRFDSAPPNNGRIWDAFEEGRWYHPGFVDEQYARWIIEIALEEDERSGGALLPKLKRGAAITAALAHGTPDISNSPKTAVSCTPVAAIKTRECFGDVGQSANAVNFPERA